MRQTEHRTDVDTGGGMESTARRWFHAEETTYQVETTAVTTYHMPPSRSCEPFYGREGRALVGKFGRDPQAENNLIIFCKTLAEIAQITALDSSNLYSARTAYYAIPQALDKGSKVS